MNVIYKTIQVLKSWTMNVKSQLKMEMKLNLAQCALTVVNVSVVVAIAIAIMLANIVNVINVQCKFLETLLNYCNFLLNFFIFRINGLECGGIDHASCNCGVCECLPAWSGPLCDCSSSQSNCIAPDTKNSDIDKVCSGHGTCQCNQCECDSSYFGKFCEISVGNETQSSLCIFYEPCVQCIINRKLEKECLDYNEKCISRTGELYQSEFYDDISGERILVRFT